MIKFILNKSIFFDLIICLLVSTSVLLFKPYFKNHFSVPTLDNLDSFCALLITIGTTFIGFFLTVITVIVTFKNAFDGQVKVGEHNTEKPNQNPDEGVMDTIFDKTVSKETQFYGSELYKNVLTVFINATYEIGFAMLALLMVESKLLNLIYSVVLLIVISSFILIALTVIRCLYIFKLYLKVHIN